jgi:hypothetical protein
MKRGRENEGSDRERGREGEYRGKRRQIDEPNKRDREKTQTEKRDRD